MAILGPLTDQEYRTVREHLLGCLDGAEKALASFKALNKVNPHQHVEQHITYWRNVVSALRWALKRAEYRKEKALDV